MAVEKIKSKKTINIATRLGQQDIALDKVLTFPHGLIGFETQREFTLIRIREESPFLLLQSLQDSGLGLIVTDPCLFLDNYPITISDAEQRLLKVDSDQQLTVLVTVSIPMGKPECTSLNLSGPILINHEIRVGLQVPQSNPNLSPKVYLNPQANCKE